MTSQKRAAKGGEVGTNGEFYEGGKFLPSTAAAKRPGSRPKGGPRKEQYEPYKWSIAPIEGQRAIFTIVGAQAAWVDSWDARKVIMPYEPSIGFYGTEFLGHSVADLCEAYNRGERWFTPK